MSLGSLNAYFLALTAASLAVTLTALYISDDEAALTTFLIVLLPILAVIAALVVLTRRFWTNARRVN